MQAQVVEESCDIDAYETNMNWTIHSVEKELGAYITDDYPLIKLLSQRDFLLEYNKEMEKEMKKNK